MGYVLTLSTAEVVASMRIAILSAALIAAGIAGCAPRWLVSNGCFAVAPGPAGKSRALASDGSRLA